MPYLLDSQKDKYMFNNNNSIKTTVMKITKLCWVEVRELLSPSNKKCINLITRNIEQISVLEI